jgi:AsmA protein
MAKKLIYIAGGIVVLLLLVAAILPFVIDVNQYRPTIESMMNTALGRKVDIGNIRLSIFSGGVSVENLSITDDPAFSAAPFVKAKSVTIAVEMMPLIFSRALHVTGLTIEEPEVTLLRSPSGVWNFSNLGAPATPAKAGSNTTPPSSGSGSTTAGSGAADNLSVARLDIKNGTVSIGNTGPNSKTHVYSQLNLSASNLSTTTEFPFELTLQAPDDGSISLKGKAGPLNQANMQATQMSADLEVKSLNVASTGFVDPASGIAGIIDFTGTLASDGKQVSTMGTVTASKLQLVPGAMPAGQPVKINYATQYDLTPQTGVLKQGDVHLGNALAQLTGSYKTNGQTTSLDMKLAGNNMPATDLEAFLPALGVTLPSGSSLKAGALNVNLTITGPTDHLVIAGPINLANATLSGFDLGGKMKVLSTFGGIPMGKDTVIQTFSSTVRVATDGIRADSINLVVASIGTITGAGTISPSQALDFKMAAKLGSVASPLGAISSLAALSGGGQAGKGGSGIPFRIQGTTSNPSFTPDFGGLTSGLAGGLGNGGKAIPASGADLGKALGGLFGKKK